MITSEKHVGAEGESEDPFCHRCTQSTLYAGPIPRRESPKVFGMGEGTTPIPTSGGHWGDPPTNRGLEAESRIP